MRAAIALGITALAVSGCVALPSSVQIVSWAVDGFSYMVSQKSVVDHGLSAAMQKDCAFWRGLTDGQICHADDATTMIAKAEDTLERTGPDNLNNPADEPWVPGPYLTITPALDELLIPGPYLTIEPNSAPKHEELAALSEPSPNVR